LPLDTSSGGQYGKATISHSGDVSMACWFNSTSIINGWGLISLQAADAGNGTRQAVSLNVGGHLTGDPIYTFSNDNVAGGSFSVTSTGFSANTWHHAGGSKSSTTVASYIDGGSKGTASSQNPSSTLDNLGIGVHPVYDNANFQGQIYWPAVWSVVLTDAEFDLLADGWHTDLIRPESRLYFYPLGGIAGDHANDLWGGANLTLTGSPGYSLAPNKPFIHPLSRTA